MRVGILTFHEIYNPGAFLQALGTCTLLREMGHDPWIIHYTSPPHRFSVGRIVKNWRLWRHPVHIVELFGRNAAFQREQVHLPLTQKCLTHEEVSREKFDAVLIGADIVWDYKTPSLGSDPIYFGHHLSANRKISFAASCGALEELNHPPEFVVEGIQSLSAVSVRDENTRRLVHQYGHRDATIICDPAFHLNDADWLERLSPKTLLEPYVLVYMNLREMNRSLIEQVKDYAKKNGLKTVAVCYRHKWVDKNLICISPFEWLSAVHGAQCIVTNTFHGTVFAIKASVPFGVELSSSVRHKAASMIEHLGLQDRVLREPFDVQACMDLSWPVAGVHEKVQVWRSEARTFLEGALDPDVGS